METATDTPDDQNQRDVLAELEWEPRVRPNEIGVAVKDGIVTLMGWVDSYAERTDADIAAAAARALAWNALLPRDQIDVTVSKGWVTLKGEVEWQFQRDEAERVIRNLIGVKGVTNQLAVKPRLTPSGLKEKIEESLLRSAKTGAARITVKVQGGKVILKGKGRALPEREEAERVAWSAPGVTSVENRITISYASRHRDRGKKRRPQSTPPEDLSRPA
jgi:osmotically-inducible protein OsmY